MARTIAKDHDQKRHQILKSAAKVFADQGYDRASMNMLAAECGISKANIYHYYDGKEALLFDILDTYLAELRDRILAVPLGGLAPSEQLHHVCSEILRAYEGMDDEHQLQTSGIAALPPDQQQVLRDYQRELVAHMMAILQACARERFGDDRQKLRGATMSVFGMLNWFYMWNAGATPEARDAYAAMVANLTLGGLSAL